MILGKKMNKILIVIIDINYNYIKKIKLKILLKSDKHKIIKK